MNLLAHDNFSEFTINDASCLVCGLIPSNEFQTSIILRTREIFESGYLNAIDHVKRKNTFKSLGNSSNHLFSWGLRMLLRRKIDYTKKIENNNNIKNIDNIISLWQWDFNYYINHFENSIENQFFSRDEINRWLIDNEINSLYVFKHQTERTKSKHIIEYSNTSSARSLSTIVDAKYPKIDTPYPLTTLEIAACFNGLNFTEAQWKDRLGNSPLWLLDCRAIRGSAGRSQARWNPVKIGSTLIDERGLLVKTVRSRFQTQELLKPWFDEWELCEQDRYYLKD